MRRRSEPRSKPPLLLDDDETADMTEEEKAKAKAQKEAFYFSVAGLTALTGLGFLHPETAAAAINSPAAIDPFFQFNPVCPASDGVFRVGQRAALALAGDQNIENYRPLINDVLIRVRTELCVLESFSRRDGAAVHQGERSRLGLPHSRDERDVPRGRRLHGWRELHPPRIHQGGGDPRHLPRPVAGSRRAGRGTAAGDGHPGGGGGETRAGVQRAHGEADGGGEGFDDEPAVVARGQGEADGGGERAVRGDDGGHQGGGGRASEGRRDERAEQGEKGAGAVAVPLRLYGKASGLFRQGCEVFDTFCSRYFVAFTVTYIIVKTAHYVFFPTILDGVGKQLGA